MTYDKKGTIRLLPHLEAYHKLQCLVNIVSLDLLQAMYYAQFHSALDNAFTVTLSDTHQVLFCGFSSGLYLANVSSVNYNINSVNPYPFTLFNTASKKKAFFT